ncbi:conserved hypothetical protein [Treponema phagedenis]|uniref:Uncharacterized protein n=1 Tax=Treponema phagedenis TaxID=162 RepID=A0A0B7GWY3_TREPH|nr:conserved hypothetical protein [Treponema phagedenis]
MKTSIFIAAVVFKHRLQFSGRLRAAQALNAKHTLKFASCKSTTKYKAEKHTISCALQLKTYLLNGEH